MVVRSFRTFASGSTAYSCGSRRETPPLVLGGEVGGGEGDRWRCSSSSSGGMLCYCAPNLFTSHCRREYIFCSTSCLVFASYVSATAHEISFHVFFFIILWGLKGKINLAESQWETNWTHESLPLHGGGGGRGWGGGWAGSSLADIPLNLIHYCVATLLWLHAGNWATAAAPTILMESTRAKLEKENPQFPTTTTGASEVQTALRLTLH